MNSDLEDDMVEIFMGTMKEQKEKHIEDSYMCDCELNYGKRCKYPSKYRTTGCDGK